MKHYKLDYYVDKLKKGEKFSFARYGDGELYCMWGKQGKNSNGCYYTPELRTALLDSMNHKNDPSFIYGLQRVLPHDEKRITAQYPDVDWHDSEFLSEAVANGELYPLIEQLRKMRVTVISNDEVGATTAELFGWKFFVSVPKSNAYDQRKKIVDMITKVPHDTDVFLFSCGMAANAIIGELHGKMDGWLLDVGHIWDPFYGLMSRCDLEGKTMEDINKNLHAKNE
jgi:hypothetical protein